MAKNIANDLFGYPERNSINSKQKGMSNERAAAKWMEKWTGYGFTRVPSSGGMHWKNNSSVCGDIVCKDDKVDIPFSVETKHLKKLHITEELRSNSTFLTIWQQATRDAERGNKHPLGLLRENGMPAGEYYFVVDFTLGSMMHIYFGVERLSQKEGEVWIFHSDEILDKVDYKELLKMISENSAFVNK